MYLSVPPKSAQVAQTRSVDLVLREARRLHRAAQSDSLSTSLPVLRRVIAAAVVPISNLPELFRNRTTLRRKHLLRTLALEAGYPSWEIFRPSLDLMHLSELEHFAVIEKGWANLNLWFSTESNAQAHASEHGGRAMCVGNQGVVVSNLACRSVANV